KTLEGRKVGVLVTEGSDAAFVQALRQAVQKAGAQLQIVAPKVGAVKGKGGTRLDADHQLAGGPSIFFDAVVVAPSENGAADLEHDAAAIDWIRDAFGHLKVIGLLEPGRRVFTRAGVELDAGVVVLGGAGDIGAFISAAKNGRVW